MGDITITTIEGTFIVPKDKQADLLFWLKQNAVRAGQRTVHEYRENQTNSTERILITE